VSSPELSRVQLWARAVRVRSFTASVIPVSIGVALAWFQGPIAWWLAAVMLVAAVTCHAGANLANDYFDDRSGVDSDASYGPKRLIASGALTARATILAAVMAFAIATALGLIIVWQTGWQVLALALASLAAAILYTGGPKPLGYMALGEVTVFLFMGLAMVMGSYYVLSGHVSWLSALAASPVGFLTAAHLHANNLRDIEVDRAAGKTTLANLLGRRRGNWEYLLLIVLAYISVLALMVFETDLWPVAMTGAAIPAAVRLVQLAFSPAAGEELNPLLRRTAGLHLRFGTLLLAGLAIAGILVRLDG
jgi:1,4-dihydroxy-2-naphthoate octaprenyltransferase